MRWKGRRESANVEDRRKVGGKAVVGGLGTLVLLAVVYFMGGDPSALLESGALSGGGGGQVAAGSGANEEMKQFAGVVLRDTEEIWHEEFRKIGRRYEEPKLVLFSDKVRSGCGFASAQVGPFYCPADKTIYIDLTFFQELKQKFGAPGDFAQAYVIAHEVGHHVQNLLGVSAQMAEARGELNKEEYNELSVRVELQADFYAGLWARRGQEKFEFLEPGDLEEALRAANAIGDDTLQKQSQGYVVPDAFTHGTSEQRMRWFRRGLEASSMRDGDTFRGRDL